MFASSGVLFVLASFSSADGYNLPNRVKVLPVWFAPKGEAAPTKAEQTLFLKHLAFARTRFKEMLGDTFELAADEVKTVRGERPLACYRNRPENGAPDVVVELLRHFEVTRFDCPYVFCTLFANPKDNFPVGGGRPINGGLNSGGGFMFISSSEVQRNKHFQTTLQHEIGHAFGLPHVDVYGYDMKSNASIMSYNPAHHMNGFKPGKTPGVLNPEDLRALAFNDRVFADCEFDPKRHVPRGYKLSPKVVPLGPMTLPNTPDFYPTVTTDAGEAVRSKVANVVSGEIKPSTGPGITYDAKCMWHSDKLPNKVATLEIAFPFAVELTGLAIHSQHSGRDHEATAVKVEADGKALAQSKLPEVDATVTFPKTTAKNWTLKLTAGKSGILVIRGVRFLNGDRDLVPRLVPYRAE